MGQQNYEVDVAKYAKIEESEKDVTLTWEEYRDVFKVVVVCCEPTTLSNVKLQYWQNHLYSVFIYPM